MPQINVITVDGETGETSSPRLLASFGKVGDLTRDGPNARRSPQHLSREG